MGYDTMLFCYDSVQILTKLKLEEITAAVRLGDSVQLLTKL